jgi:hypothetical protein
MRFVVNNGFDVSSTRTNTKSALEGISTVQGLFIRRRGGRGLIAFLPQLNFGFSIDLSVGTGLT